MSKITVACDNRLASRTSINLVQVISRYTKAPEIKHIKTPTDRGSVGVKTPPRIPPRDQHGRTRGGSRAEYETPTSRKAYCWYRVPYPRSHVIRWRLFPTESP